MKYTKIPNNTFKNLQMNAGILVDDFDPSTGEFGNIIGATTGGLSFADAISWKDFGEDIDNCPKNMMELKKLDEHDVTLSGTFLTIDADAATMLVAVADVDELDATHIVPRNDVLMSDFTEVWWVGDYSDENTGESAGFIAVHLFNALNTGGFQIKSTDKEKGQFAFTFTGHYSMAAQDRVPYELYIKGGSTTGGSIVINRHTITLTEGDDYELRATFTPASAEGDILWSVADSEVASIRSTAGSRPYCTVTAVAEGNTIVRAYVTVDGVTYDDTCTVIVEAAAESDDNG